MRAIPEQALTRERDQDEPDRENLLTGQKRKRISIIDILAQDEREHQRPQESTPEETTPSKRLRGVNALLEAADHMDRLQGDGQIDLFGQQTTQVDSLTAGDLETIMQDTREMLCTDRLGRE